EPVLQALDVVGQLGLAGAGTLDDRRRGLRRERLVGEPGASRGQVALGLGELLLPSAPVGAGRPRRGGCGLPTPPPPAANRERPPRPPGGGGGGSRSTAGRSPSKAVARLAGAARRTGNQ